MTGEQLKADLQRIAPKDYPVYCANHGVASFLLPALNPDGTDSLHEDIGWTMSPLPPRMHCVLREFGSIYMVGPEIS